MTTIFINMVKAAYTLKERLQTIHKPKQKKGSSTYLIGYSVPTDMWLASIEKTVVILKEQNIKYTLPTTKSGHVSVCVVTDLTSEERDLIRKFTEKEPRPSFVPVGIDLLPGSKFNPNLDYLSLSYTVPDEYKRLFTFVRELCGAERISDFRTWFKDHKPHSSMITTTKTEREEVQKLIPKVWETLKPSLHSFKPEFIEFFDKMELSEFHEIKGCLTIADRFYK